MDERQKRILASLVAGSALSLTLGVTASAEEVTNTEIQESISQTNEVGSTNGTGSTGSTGTGTTDTNGTGTTGPTGTGTTDTNGTGTTDTNGTGTTGTTGTGTTDTNGTGSTGSTETGGTNTTETGTTGTTETGSTGTTGTGSTGTTETGGTNTTDTTGTGSTGSTETGSTDANGTGGTNTPEGGNANEGSSANEGNSTNEGNSAPEGTVASEPVTYTTPETTPAETGTTPPVVTVKGGALTAGDEKWDDENKAGLRFDKASGSVVMVNNSNAVTIQTDSKGVNLSVAGVNRISTLYADGDVNITGTGIVLIDSIDMPEGTNLNLLTNTNIYTEGSAAVFLKTGEGVYQLINGEVSGILDEEYTIPDGVMLVVPNGGTLDMRVTTTVKTETTDSVGTQTETHYGFTDAEKSILESDSEEEKKIFTESGVTQDGVVVKKSVIFSTPKLNIAAKSVLHIQEGGQLLMNAFRNETLGVVNSSTLEVSGILGLDGKIRAYQGSGVGQAENFYLNIKDTGFITGLTENGTLSGVTVVYEDGAGDVDGDTLNITGDGSYVKINNGGIANLNTSGNTGVVFDNGASIGNITAEEGGSVTFYATDYTAQMQADAIEGDYGISSGYVKVGNGFAKENFKPAENGIPFLSNGGIMGQKETSVARLEFWRGISTLGQGTSFWKSSTLTGFGSNIDYSYLSGNAATRGFDYYEVFLYDDATEETTLQLLTKDSVLRLPAGNIRMIRGVNFNSRITVGNEILNGASASWNTDSKSGWRYDGSGFSMVNNGNAVDVKAEGKGVDFSVAGLNRIGTLYADADVNFTGTGIVLIDSLDLKKGANLNLLNIKDVYQNGSAAVFLKNANGEYVLINGRTPGVSVPGILDEKYTIPDGVTLVVPKDGVLKMLVTTSVTTTTTVEKNGTTTTQTKTHYGMAEDERNQAVYNQPTTEIIGDTTTKVSKSLHFTVPELNISSKAVLRIQQGAQLLMQAFKDVVNGVSRSSTLNVSGTLELDGQMKATGDSKNGTDANLWLNVKSGGSVTGTGTITNATIRYETGAGDQDQLNIAGDRNIIELNSSGIGALDVDGKADVYYADNVTIGSVSVDNSGENTITFYGKKELNRLNITNSIAGNYTISSGYLTVGGNYANKTFDSTTAGTPIRTEICIAPTKGGGSILELKPGDFFSYVKNTNTANFGFESKVDGYTGDSINWADLTSKLGEYHIFEVYTRGSDGKVTMHLFSGDQDGTMSTSGVFLIRGVNFDIVDITYQPSGDISTGTSNTGSGVLGGGNAGSFNGGSASGVWNGNRDSQTGGQNDTLTGTDTGSTGSGVLGGGSSLVGGKPVGVLGGTRKPPAPPTTPATPDTPQEASQPDAPKQETSKYDLVLKVTGSGTEYDLKAFYDGIELKELGGGTVTVEMEVQLNPGWNPNDLFAVFRDEQGKLVAVRVRYDALTGKLEFDAPMLGQFRLVYLDWDGTDYTDEAFLAAILAAL